MGCGISVLTGASSRYTNQYHTTPRELGIQQFEGLDNMLKWILLQRKESRETKQEINSNFICYRGVLRLIMNTPYEQREGWIIKVVRFKGTVYMMQIDTEEQKEKKKWTTEKEKTFCAWGYKFEQYMSVQEKSAVVNENEEFCCMFRSKIGKYSFLFGAEMDGYKAQDKQSIGKLVPNRFVEFKTSRRVENERQDRTLRKFKMIKWWAQCFLVGIEEVVVGWRDDAGIVEQVETLPVSSLPKRGMEWRANVCANFLLEFITFIQQNLLRDSSDQVYNVSWDPRSGFKVQQDSEQFFPPWFLAEFK
ncbi:decapping and exoribonuclease protein isoform X2 [Eurytemora carolleeae]|uniref:decapping and exoribonuclease protein isoform X2 n=1 Tax=Eurytemora carolleeae TaxID=1294199 RepID=UPI000C76D9E9|nr:decapping and exoribonuclease protein isoform X2 [Eurytemora carolleeae]|eukprot:XP_023338933.1 decapping and exoribonuclease protein-like isoform X2 [Eurytemora affinis]